MATRFPFKELTPDTFMSRWGDEYKSTDDQARRIQLERKLLEHFDSGAIPPAVLRATLPKVRDPNAPAITQGALLGVVRDLRARVAAYDAVANAGPYAF